MSILGNTRLFGLAVVAAGLVACGSSDALARHRGGYGSYGSAGSYGSYGSTGIYGGAYASYGSTGSYGSYAGGGSHGERQGLFARWHARKAARKAAGSHGSYASYGSSGSSGGSYAVSYGSSGSYGGYGSSGSYGGGVIYESAPTYSAPLEADPALDPNGGDIGPPPVPTEPSASATDATIWVSLPADAKVFVNDRQTASTGAERQYVSRGLQSGRTYSYKLRVEFQRDGQPVVEDKLVRLQAGQAVSLAFGSQATDEQSAKTELKLHVPEAAKVTLAGLPTQQTGAERTYATTGLKNGQVWDNYVVRVELEQDGQTLVEERTVSIEGGKTQELTFDLNQADARVAAL